MIYSADWTQVTKFPFILCPPKIKKRRKLKKKKKKKGNKKEESDPMKWNQPLYA